LSHAAIDALPLSYRSFRTGRDSNPRPSRYRRRIRLLHCAERLILVLLFIFSVASLPAGGRQGLARTAAQGVRPPNSKPMSGMAATRVACGDPLAGMPTMMPLHYRRMSSGRESNPLRSVRSNRVLQYAAEGRREGGRGFPFRGGVTGYEVSPSYSAPHCGAAESNRSLSLGGGTASHWPSPAFRERTKEENSKPACACRLAASRAVSSRCGGQTKTQASPASPTVAT
jgi:hypothetical protein